MHVFDPFFIDHRFFKMGKLNIHNLYFTFAVTAYFGFRLDPFGTERTANPPFNTDLFLLARADRNQDESDHSWG
jgi:hypothetical protein